MRPIIIPKNIVTIIIVCSSPLQGNFDKAVEILKPIRYKVDLLGGSRAQVRIWGESGKEITQ